MDNGASSYRRFLDGDDNGLVEIIKDYKDGLMLYLNGYVQNIHIAEDLMEDVFIRLVIKKPHFTGRSSFKTWLYSIGRNVAVDYVRKNSKYEILSEEDQSLILRDEQDVELEYIRNERKIIVHRSLRRIKPEYRRALYLIYFEDFNIKEAAFIMKKSYKQTENLIYRAKLSLKSELEKEGFVYEEL